jgi:outer membrane protein assembly factor BamA/autotransporter translocation and assembly factor TamB
MRFRRRLIRVAAALAATAVAFVLLLHAPPVRRAALRYARPAIERQYGLRLDASRLDYNLAALRIGLADVRLAAPHSADEPFVSAAYVSVTLARTVLSGQLTFDEIAATNARVLVRRRPDGSTNLPSPAGEPDDDPPPLGVNRIDIPQIALDLRDEQEARFLWIPALALQITPESGFIRMAREAELNTETQITSVNRLEGEVRFDGRALHVANLQVALNELDATLDGSVTLVAREPAIALNARGSIDAARVARWVVANGYLPIGDVAFEAGVAGPFANLDTRLLASTDRITWAGVAATEVAARLHVTAESAELEELRLAFEGGRVTASARLPLTSDGTGRLDASWNGIDAASATRVLAPDLELLPSASVSGRIEAAGPGMDPTAWSARAKADVSPRPNSRGRLALGGTLALDLQRRIWRLEGRHTIGSVAPLTLRFGGRLTDGGAPENLIDGQIHVGDTDLARLAAVLRATGIVDIPSEAVAAGTLAGDVRMTGGTSDFRADGRAAIRGFAGSQIEIGSLEASFSGRPLRQDVMFQASSPEAVVGGQPFAELRVTGGFAEGLLDIGEISARQPSGTGVLTADGAYSLRTRRYVVSLDGRDWQLRPTDDLPIGGRAALRFAGEGSIAAPRGLGEVTVSDSSWDGRSLGVLEAAIALEGRMATIQATAPEFAAHADARVALDPPYGTTVDLRARGVSLARLLEGVETAIPLSGTTTVAAHAELPLEAWRSGSARLEVASLDALAGDLPIRLAGPTRLRYERERVYVDRLEADAGQTRISATGDLPVGLGSDPSVRLQPDPTDVESSGIIVTATGDVVEVARAAAATGFVDVPVTGGAGPVALLARVTGAIEAPVVAADLEIGPGSIAIEDVPRISNLRVRARAEEGWIELREGLASYQNADLTVTGRAPISLFSERGAPGTSRPAGADASAVVRARAANLTPAVLSPFLDPETAGRIEGSMDATLEASASSLDLAAVTGEFRIDRFEVRVADLPVTQRVPTRIVARDGFARVEAWDWVGQGATLAVRGQVRLEDRQAAILANGVVDLRVLTPFVRDAGLTTAGRLEPRLSITGPIDDPRIDGDMNLSDGELRVVDPRVLVTDLAARTVLTRTTARIVSLTGSINGGSLGGGGSVGVTPDGAIDAQLSTVVRGMALEFPQGLRSELDADLVLATEGPPIASPGGTRPALGGKLSGTVTVLRSTYREPMAVVTGMLAGLRTQRIAVATEASPALDALSLDVRVVTNEDVIVDNNYARAQIGGDLRVIGTAAAPAVSGRAELREGGQLFVGRNVYTVNVGAIDFANPVAIEPLLNVEAATRAGGEDIEVTISGSAESPSVTLQSPSNPDLGQAELASLLLTGRRLEDLAPGDAAFVGTQVLGNFSAEVLGFASRAVGLDTLRLGGVEGAAVRRDAAAVATELDPTTRLTFGKSLGADVDVTYSQSLRDGDAQSWIVDYLPARGLELRLVSDDDDLRSYGFRHDVSLGGPARQARPDVAARPADLRVSRVDLSGDLVLPEARVRGALDLAPGDRFDFVRWQTDRDRLDALYRAEGYLTARIAARRASVAGAGVTLTYEIGVGPRTRIEVTGIELDAALRTEIETAWAQSVFDDFLLEEAAQVVRRRLARDGYLQPSIDARVSEAERTTTLAIAVDRGTRSITTTVRVEEVPGSGSPGRTPLAETIVTHLAERGLIAGAVSDPGAVEREVTSVLRMRGHLGARVSTGAPLFEGTTAVLPLTVEAGPAYTVTSVRFEGASVLPEEGLRKAAALDASTPYDPGLVAAARDRLVALYRREGFASASVTARPTVRTEAASADVAFVVAEGRRHVLGDVVVSGNRAIDADVIARAIDLAPGAPLRTDEVMRARTRVFDTGLFRRIDITSEPMEATEASVPVRLRASVEEWPAARLRYGFVVAEERPAASHEGRDLVPGFAADLTRRTLFGRAIAVGGAVEVQRRDREVRGFLTAPTLLGWPIQSSMSVSRTRRTIAESSRIDDRNGVSWEQQFPFVPGLELSYGYRFERSRTELPRDPIIGSLPAIVLNIARLNATASWDRRDDPSDTARGAFVSSNLEFAPESLGSDIRFIRQLSQAYFFQPRRRVVLASAARVGVVVPLSGQDLILSERFFAGGSRTVRGFTEDGVGPRDFFGDPAGGQLMIVLNQEARVPVSRWLRGVAFVDAGNVFTRPRDASLRDLVGSVGVGVRVPTPFALLRADYARPAWGTDRKGGRWTFGIGQAF